MSSGGLENSGESAGIGVFGGSGETGGDEDIGDNEDDGHGDGENGEEENELGDSGAEEHVVDIESFLGLAGGHWMVSLMGEDLLSFILSQLD